MLVSNTERVAGMVALKSTRCGANEGGTGKTVGNPNYYLLVPWYPVSIVYTKRGVPHSNKLHTCVKIVNLFILLKNIIL